MEGFKSGAQACNASYILPRSGIKPVRPQWPKTWPTLAPSLRGSHPGRI